MAVGDIQTSFAAGELSPQLYARVDFAKFQVGAALLRNWFVDYRGGVSNRAGTRYIDTVPAGARLVPFVVSTSAAYVLVFSNQLVTIYNKGVFVTTVALPYVTADLFTIAYTQSADVLTLVHPNYPPAELSRTSDTTFTYAVIVTGPAISPPTITTMPAPHSGPYSFGYLVTSVDINGKEESLPSNPGVKHSEGMNETTNRVIGLGWTAPAQAVDRYNVYKWGPVDAVTMNPATVWGFIGSSQTTTFTDINIAPDFSKQPPGWGDPFSGGQFNSINVNAPGSAYDGVAGDWPTATPYVPLTITGDGTGAAGYAVINHALGTICGVFLTNPGKNYTTATISANGQGGSGATFTYDFTDIRPLNPAAVGYLQQRRVFGGATLKPETYVMSQPGLFKNFNSTPVTLASDAIVASIAAEEVNTIKSFVQVNYGLIAFTTGGSFLLNGGAPGAPIDANSPAAQPQVSQGANNLRPIRINYDVIYGQAKGNRIHNLAFAWQKQSYTGSDISSLAAHLFDTYMTVDWCYAEEPFKIVWAVRDDGKLLSLTYVPDQEVYAWCRHDTQGLFKSVCSVPEDNVDAVYFIVQRHIPNALGTPSWVNYLERMAERQGCCIFDAWFLDCALSLSTPAGTTPLYITPGAGTAVTLNTYDPNSAPSGSFSGAHGAPPTITGIQQFLGASDPTNSHQQFAVDWDNLRFFASNNGTTNAFNIATAASYATIAAAPFDQGVVYGDGKLYLSQFSGNQGILFQYDPATLLQLQTFGGGGGGFSSNATHAAVPADVVVLPATTGHLLITSAANINEISFFKTGSNAFPLDTVLGWGGTNYTTNEGRGRVCNARKHGVRSNTLKAFVLGLPNFPLASTSVYALTIILSGVGIASSSLTRLFGVNASALGWTNITGVSGVMLDETDMHLIAVLSSSAFAAWNSVVTYYTGYPASKGGHDYLCKFDGQTNVDPTTNPAVWTDLGPSGPVQTKIAKINSQSGAVMWSTVISGLPNFANGFGPMGQWNSNLITNGLYCYFDQGTGNIHEINTITGVDTQVHVSGIGPNEQVYNSLYGQLIFNGSYNNGVGGAPAPIGATAGVWANRWATLGPAGGPAFPSSVPTIVGQTIQIGCGKIQVTGQASTSQATGNIIAPLDLAIPDDPTGALMPVLAGGWTFTTPVSTVSGLDHLEGKEVWALADGVVAGPLTVTGGTVFLPNPATNIVVGLKYTQQIQTLYLTTEGIQEGSDQGKRKLITGVTLRVDCTANIWAGTDFGPYLTQVPETLNTTGAPLFKGDARVLSFPNWDERGFTCIEQFDPLPASILGVIVEVTPGDTGS